MSSFDGRSSTTAEAARTMWEATRRYQGDSASIGHDFLTAWAVTTQVNLRTAFDWQSAAIQASQHLVDTAGRAGLQWFDQMAASLWQSQVAAIRLMSAGLETVRTTWPRPER